ncbi:MAG: DNA starvation/stationary phase protection protein [Bacteroidota bacterium]
MTTEIGISDINRQDVANELSKLLADEMVLYVKTKNATWNVEGADFNEKHKFFESQMEQLDEMIEDVAEHIRSIGHYAPASLELYLKLTHLTEKVNEQNDSQGFIKNLLEAHESIIIILRKHVKSFAIDYHDVGTSNFITGLMDSHEIMAWLLRSHVPKHVQ